MLDLPKLNMFKLSDGYWLFKFKTPLWFWEDSDAQDV